MSPQFRIIVIFLALIFFLAPLNGIIFAEEKTAPETTLAPESTTSTTEEQGKVEIAYKWKCPYCGQVNSSDDIICVFCHNQKPADAQIIVEEVSPQIKIETEEGKKNLKMNYDKFTTSMFFLYVTLILFYGVFFYYWRRRKMQRTAKWKFTRGIISILKSCQKDKDCVSQINMIFKRLSEKYSIVSDIYKSAVDVIEEFICSVDTLSAGSVKDMLGGEEPSTTRKRLIGILNIMKQKQPFSSLSTKEANLLSMLDHAITSTNIDLARNSISQIADSIELLEGRLRIQSKWNRISFTISAVGVILTAFFGILSFILFMLKT